MLNNSTYTEHLQSRVNNMFTRHEMMTYDYLHYLN